MELREKARKLAATEQEQEKVIAGLKEAVEDLQSELQD
jgi:hypothetical protein